MKQETTQNSRAGRDGQAAGEQRMGGFAEAAGKILAISYPVLALSTGARAVYQLFFKEGVSDRLPPALTAIAAALYLVATVGFARRTRPAWTISVTALTLELIGIAVVGVLSYTNPDLVGETAWRHFGADYAYFPLIQPVLGLIWLLHPQTVRAFGIRRGPAPS
jgi:hypothetical protein